MIPALIASGRTCVMACSSAAVSANSALMRELSACAHEGNRGPTAVSPPTTMNANAFVAGFILRGNPCRGRTA